jgi:hypothetical protein
MLRAAYQERVRLATSLSVAGSSNTLCSHQDIPLGDVCTFACCLLLHGMGHCFQSLEPSL